MVDHIFHAHTSSFGMKGINVKKTVKRKSSVVSTQTYRKMVEDVLEESPACALDLHGIYEALAKKYEQYREDSVEVDWRVGSYI